MMLETKSATPLELYRLLVGGIVPRPIAWVSTQNSAGLSNLAPYSFFSVASCNPPILTITNVASQNKVAKDTLNNLLQTNECVVNIVSASQVDEMNQSCAPYSEQQSEIDEIGIETVASQTVAPLGVKGSAVRYECRLRETITLSDKPMGGVLILLDVVAISVEDSVIKEGMIDANLLQAVGKLGGNDYCNAQADFMLLRPEL
ncbi:MAG: flavin reductase family protein [Thiotrichales bacterium]|nr:flavin reductase family protein [Thiotrichales bacterium]